MNRTKVLAAKRPKSLVSIRQKTGDLLDARDLRRAMKEATGFHPWESIKKRAARRSSC